MHFKPFFRTRMLLLHEYPCGPYFLVNKIHKIFMITLHFRILPIKDLTII